MNVSYSMSQPSSSQSLSGPKIFVAPNGAPLPIFVESNGVSNNRPKLMKTLRSHGASICVDVSLARIILVEPHSSEGRQFVRDWGMDPGKVILEVDWIRRCIEAGRALLENDAWGGCGNLDGTPLEDDPDLDDERGFFTDSNATVLNGRHRPAPARVSPRTPRRTGVANGHTSAIPSPQPAPDEYGASSSSTAAQHNSDFSLSQSLPTPPLTSGPGQSNPPSTSQAQPFLPPNVPQNMAQPFGQLVPQSQFPMNTLNPQMLQAFMMANPDAMQLFMSMMTMQGMPNGPLMSQGWPIPPHQTFMQVPPGPPMMQPPPQSQSLPSMVAPYTGMSEHYTSAPAAIHDPSPPVKLEPRSQSDSMSPLPTFTAVDDSDSDSSPPNLSIFSQRGKKHSRDNPDLDSPKPSKRPRSPHSRKHEKKRYSLPVLGTNSQRNPTVQDRPPSNGVFTSNDGEPLKFYVQVQLRNRNNILKQVRTNGGKIISDLPEANFIILDTRPGKERDMWMKVVRDLKRFALRPGFIEACLNSKGIVEEEDFIIEPVKKSRKSSSPRRKKSEESVETEEKTSPPPSSSSQGRDGAQQSSRSPSPPISSSTEAIGGRCPFTPEEISYARRFAEHLCRKDPAISYNQIATELARRAPRHPVKSWLSITIRCHRSELDRFRERVLRERRNGPCTAGPSGSEPEIEEQLMLPIEDDVAQAKDTTEAPQLNGSDMDISGPEPGVNGEPSNLHDEDLRTIVHFFAHPPEGIVDDDVALWAALTEAYVCHTAPSWQDFYAANQEVVNQRLREALKMLSNTTAVNTT